MRILKPVRLVKPVSRCAGFDIMNIPSDRAALFLQHGQPNLTLPLPSRGEPVLFTIKPVTGSVGSLINDIIKTDGGVHQAEILSKDGKKLAKSTSLSHLLQLGHFSINLNGEKYPVSIPDDVAGKMFSPSIPPDNGVNEMRYQIARIYTALNIESRQFEKEEELLREREEIMRDLKPFLDLNEKLCEQVAKRTLLMQYGILGGMCVQAGILARLTWFEYSWDIMEPVTYFITYGTMIGLYGFYILSKTEPEYDQYETRLRLKYTHKFAPEVGFNIQEFNGKVRRLEVINRHLNRLRDPLRMQLPIRQIRNKTTEDVY